MTWTSAASAGDPCQPEEVAKLLPSDGAFFDMFGGTVEIDGDTAIVGSFLDDDQGSDSGSAYIFIRSGDDWIQQQKLTAPDGAGGDWFGLADDVEGDTAVVGAPFHGQFGSERGAAYVFVRSGTTWTLQQKLTASDDAAGDWFGVGVRISGDTIIVGAEGDDDNGADSGSAYIFTRSGDTWTEQQKITASDGAADEVFGTAVHLDGDSAIVGSRGSAYVFVRSGTIWTEQHTLSPSDGAADLSDIRMSVIINGDTAIVGPEEFDGDAGEFSGAAFVFVRAGDTWTQQQMLTASDGAPGDFFGFFHALEGDLAVVTAFFDDDQGTDSGSAYVFVRSGSVWTEQAKITASDGEPGDGFGLDVAISGNTAIVGAQFDLDANFANGSAYIFELNCMPAIPGDIDGDGDVDFDDLTTLLASWGPCKECPADLDGDGDVDFDDFTTLLANWT